MRQVSFLEEAPEELAEALRIAASVAAGRRDEMESWSMFVNRLFFRCAFVCALDLRLDEQVCLLDSRLLVFSIYMVLRLIRTPKMK